MDAAANKEEDDMPSYNPITSEKVSQINQDLTEKERAAGERNQLAYLRSHPEKMWKEAAERGFSGRIFCMMGKSASGKDTIYSKVLSKLERDGFDIAQIVTYTTRPKRTHERDGDEYFFLSGEELDEKLIEGRVIERRNYDTEYGMWSYATLDDGQIAGDQNYLVIGTPDVYESFTAYFSHEQVIPILVVIDDGTRLMRALTREMQQEAPKFDEMCRRYLSDKRDFAEIDAAEGVARFTNRDADECAAEIAEFIENA